MVLRIAFRKEFCSRPRGLGHFADSNRTSGNLWDSTNWEFGSTHHVWSFLWIKCQQIGSWCQHYLIWILESKLILSNNQSIATSVSFQHMSHCWTSAFNDHLDHCFVGNKMWKLRFALRGMCVCGNIVYIRQQINISNFPFVWIWLCFASRFQSHICFQMLG